MSPERRPHVCKLGAKKLGGGCRYDDAQCAKYNCEYWVEKPRLTTSEKVAMTIMWSYVVAFLLGVIQTVRRFWPWVLWPMGQIVLVVLLCMMMLALDIAGDGDGGII